MTKRKYFGLILAFLAIICFSLVSLMGCNKPDDPDDIIEEVVEENSSVVFLNKEANYELTENYKLNKLEGFSKNSFYNNGLLFSTTEEGASYYLAKGCSKEFSFIALPIAKSLNGIDLSDNTAVKNVTADFSQLTLNIGDKNGQILSIKLIGAKGSEKITNEQIKYSVLFDGKEVGIKGTINQSFRTIINGVVKPIVFYINTDELFITFDTAGKNSKQKIDLSNIDGLNLDDYSVEMKMEGLINNSEDGAKLVLLELCGQALNGSNIKPIINQHIVSNGIVGTNYRLPVVYAYDVINSENISNWVEFSVSNDSEPLVVSSDTIKFEKIGEYTISASLVNNLEVLNSVSDTITVFSLRPQIDFGLNDVLIEDCIIYDTITIPTADVSSPLFIEYVEVGLSIILDDKVIYRIDDLRETFEYKFNDHGNASLVYSVVDYFGCVTNYSIDFVVKNLPNLQNVSLPQNFSLNRSFDLTTPTMIYNGNNSTVYTEILTPSGKLIKDAKGALAVDELGVYTITYYTLVEGKQYTYEHKVESILSPASIFTEINDIVSIESNCDLPSYSLTGNGVKILGASNGASFSFNNVIDFTEYTKDDTVISLQVLNEENLAKFNEVVVTLTDVNDSSNKVSVRMLKNNSGSGADQWSYVTAKYKGSFAGISNSGPTKGTVQKVDWGGTVNYCSFSGLKYKNCTEFSFSLDYDTRSIYTTTGPKGTKKELVLDLDSSDHVGVGNEWLGFSEGKAYITVTLKGLNATGGIIVTKVANNSLSGNILVDDVAPELYLSTDSLFDVLPVGEKGKNYPLPHLYAWDMIDTNVETEVLLYKDNESNSIQFNKDDFSFVPTTSGKYYIEYRAVDNANNVSSRTVEFNVLDQIDEIDVSYKTSPEVAKLGDVYTIPEVVVEGGSSLISITEKVLYNGVEVEIGKDRQLRLNQPGKIKVVVEVVDYLGNIYNTDDNLDKDLTISIISADASIIEVQNVPTVAYKGSTLILPEYNVYNSNKEFVGVSKKVEVNGVVITDTMCYEVNEESGTILTVKYYAIGENENVKTYEVLVIDPTYVSDFLVVKNADGTLNNNLSADNIRHEKEYLEYVFSAKQEIVFPQNIVADSLNIKLGVNPEFSDFEYFDVYLKDCFDSDNVVLLRVYKDGYLEVNGDSNNRIKVKGSYLVNDSYFYFIYDNATKELLSEDGALITKITKNCAGFIFNGFNKSLANVSIVLPETNSNSSIRIMQIANQTFMSAFSGGALKGYTDRTGPLIRFDNQMENKTILKGQTIYVSKATAHDVLQTSSTINVSLICVDTGEIIYNKINCLQDISYVPTKCGSYEVKYIAKDGKNQTTKSFYFVVKELDKPNIIVDKEIPKQYYLNDTIEYINATVTDENSVKYNMLIVQPNGKYIVIKENETYTFKALGNYKIILQAEDAYYNVNRIEYDISVTAKD